jgi:hypothetical protein
MKTFMRPSGTCEFTSRPTPSPVAQPEAWERPDSIRFLSVCAFAALLSVAPAFAQQPNFSQGFGGAPQNPQRSMAERAAFSAAVNEADPAARVSAIQQFLIEYPNSTLRQPAISQMMLAKQAVRAAGNAPPAANRPEAASVLAPASPPVAQPAAAPAYGAPRPSLLDQTAKRAEITITPLAMTIKADNSALSQILHDISGSTGMKVEGLEKDERVFGTYGPGDAHTVLLSLLQGSGYNVLMVGQTASGAPRELSLTQRSTGPGASPGSVQVQRNSQEDEEPDSDPDIPQTVPEPQPPQLINQQPSGAPQPQEGRNPIELQQEMMRARQQQMQQQNPQ